jgi:hypothetical protein
MEKELINITIERKVEYTEYVTIYDTTEEIVKSCLDDIYNGSMDLESLSETSKVEYELDYDTEELMDVIVIYDDEHNVLELNV